MKNSYALFLVAVVCLVFGFLKAVYPSYFLSLRSRYPKLANLSLYSFLYKGPRATLIVRINGYALLVIGVGLIVWLVAKQGAIA